MSSFTNPLIVSPMPNGRRWRLARRFTYRLGKKYSRHFIKVPTGFLTDFASVPRIFFFLPDWATYSKAPVLHDWLYYSKRVMNKPITRKRADDIFFEAMLIDFRKHQSGQLVAWLEYIAVRIFAGKAWR